MAHQLKALPLDLVGRLGVPAADPVLPPEGREVPTSAATRPLVAEAIAHELRGTLALISAYSQTVQHLPLDNDVRVRYLERISTASMSLSELAEEVLTVASSPGRGNEPVVEPISLRQTYVRLASQFAGTGEEIKVFVDAPASLPLVDADPIWITLVVRSLVTNALKYAAGSPIRISARQSGESVVTRVADDGDGVPVSERHRLFEPSFRARAARESGSPGSGQGLYLCRRLIEAHGGRIWVDAAESGFAVEFSLARSQHRFLAAPRHDESIVPVGSGLSERRGA